MTGTRDAASVEPETMRVLDGILQRGSTLADVEACVAEWTPRLIDPAYATEFRSWIMKEYPQHPVRVAGFTAMVFPVTNAEYAHYSQTASSNIQTPESLSTGLPGDHPVWGVTLEAARAYAAWLSDATGRRWRLPQEVEWEWMARGSGGAIYPFGSTFDPVRCNTVESLRGTTTPVDAFISWPSWCGVCDLAGNVEEWCDSQYNPYPGGELVVDDLVHLLGPCYPILRGGSFLLGGDLCRGARRHGPHPGPPFRLTGFRLVHDFVQEENISTGR